jgi:hypothetical protein
MTKNNNTGTRYNKIFFIKHLTTCGTGTGAQMQ